MTSSFAVPCSCRPCRVVAHGNAASRCSFRFLALFCRRSHLHFSKMVQHSSWVPLPMRSRPDDWRHDLLYRECDIERRPGPKRALLLRDVLLGDVLPTAARLFEVAVPGFEEYLRDETFMGAKNSSLLRFRRPRTRSSKHSHLWRGALRAPSTILWCRSGRPPTCIPRVVARAAQSVPRHPGRVQNTSVSRTRVESSDVSLALQCPRTFLFPSRCSLLPAEARRLDFFGDSLSTRYEKDHGMVNIRDPETRGLAHHAAQRRVFFLDCPRISQKNKNVTSSVPDHDSLQQFGHSLLLPLQLSQRQLRSLGVSHQRYRRYGHQGGGASDHWLQYRDLPHLRRKGLSKIGSPKKLQTVSALSQSSRLVSLQYEITESPATNPCSHHVATDKVEGFTSLCAVASSNGALPTPSRLPEHHPLLLCVVAQKT